MEYFLPLLRLSVFVLALFCAVFLYRLIFLSVEKKVVVQTAENSWPMAGANIERTGWTAEEVKGQLRLIADVRETQKNLKREVMLQVCKVRWG